MGQQIWRTRENPAATTMDREAWIIIINLHRSSLPVSRNKTVINKVRSILDARRKLRPRAMIMNDRFNR